MKLYKYFPENINSLKSLSSNSLWLNSALKMNDPLESLLLLSQNYNDDELEQIRESIRNEKFPNKKEWLKYSNPQLMACLNYIRQNILSTLSFASFSEVNDNMLMWSHYASSHSGFCIEYDFNESLLNENDLVRVKYDNKIKNLRIKSLTCDEDSSYNDLVEMKKDFFENLSIKSPDWSYEKEWRLWGGDQGYEKLDNNIIITAIYFGYRTDSEFENMVINILKSTGVYDSLLIKYMSVSEHSTNLVIIDKHERNEDVLRREKIEKGLYINMKPFTDIIDFKS